MSLKHRGKLRHPEVAKYVSDLARKGGQVTGPCKRRGDSEYYRKLRLDYVAKQRGPH
jgi:hypothetical protein